MLKFRKLSEGSNGAPLDFPRKVQHRDQYSNPAKLSSGAKGLTRDSKTVHLAHNAPQVSYGEAMPNSELARVARSIAPPAFACHAAQHDLP